MLDTEWVIRELDLQEARNVEEIFDLALSGYGMECDPGDFDDETRKWPEWKRKAFAELLKNDDALMAASPIFREVNEIGGDFGSLHAVCPIVSEILKKSGKTIVFECVCDNNDEHGIVAAVGPQGWDWIGTDQIARDPLLMANVIAGVAGKDAAIGMLKDKLSELQDKPLARPRP